MSMEIIRRIHDLAARVRALEDARKADAEALKSIVPTPVDISATVQPPKRPVLSLKK